MDMRYASDACPCCRYTSRQCSAVQAVAPTARYRSRHERCCCCRGRQRRVRIRPHTHIPVLQRSNPQGSQCVGGNDATQRSQHQTKYIVPTKEAQEVTSNSNSDAIYPPSLPSMILQLADIDQTQTSSRSQYRLLSPISSTSAPLPPPWLSLPASSGHMTCIASSS